MGKIIPYIISGGIILVLIVGSLINFENTFRIVVYTVIYFFVSRILLSIIASLLKNQESKEGAYRLLKFLYILLVIGYLFGLSVLINYLYQEKSASSGNEIFEIYQTTTFSNKELIPSKNSDEIMGMDIPKE